MTSDNQIPTKEKEPWHLDSNPDIKEAVERFVLWSMWENDGRKEANIPKIRDGQNRRRKARDAICQALEKELIFLRLTGLSDVCRSWAAGANSVGRRRTTLRGGNRGTFMLGGSACTPYGDLRVGRWFLRVRRADRWQRFGRLVQPGGGHTGLRLRLSSLIGADGAGVGLDLVKRRRGRSRTGGMGERHWGFVTEPS